METEYEKQRKRYEKVQAKIERRKGLSFWEIFDKANTIGTLNYYPKKKHSSNSSCKAKY